MSSFVARDALSDHLVCVSAEARPARQDLAGGRQIVYVVFEETAQRDASSVLGLVEARQAMRFPGRIFADLVPASPPAAVKPDAPLKDVERHFRQDSAGAMLVVDEAGRLVGAVTRESVSAKLLEHERRTASGLRENLDRQEGQKRLFAFEIHDGIAQYAAAANMHLESFAALQGTMNQRAASEFKRACALLQETLREAQSLMQGLHSQLQGDLVQAVRSLIDARQSASGPAIELSVDAPEIVLSEEPHLAIYRVVQEALSNALKHSGSQRIRVELSSGHRSVQAEVRDWGRGFDPDSPSNGHGLAGIRRRASLLGGEAHVSSVPGGGTTVRVILPTPAVRGN